MQRRFSWSKKPKLNMIGKTGNRKALLGLGTGLGIGAGAVALNNKLRKD